jgi:hypothetical protein
MGVQQGKVKANKQLNLLDFTAFLNARARNTRKAVCSFSQGSASRARSCRTGIRFPRAACSPRRM